MLCFFELPWRSPHLRPIYYQLRGGAVQLLSVNRAVNNTYCLGNGQVAELFTVETK